MPTVNQVLEDEQIAHSVSLEKYKVGVVRRIIALLNRSDAELSAALSAALERLPAESFTVERLELLLAEVRATNAQAYASVAQELQNDLKELAGYEANWQQALFEKTIPEPVQVRFPIASVSAEQAYAAALSRPFQGRLLKDWGAEIAADRMVKVRNAIRTGYLEGKTTDQIIRSIRGSRATGYADGFLERPRKDLAAVVRTAISHTAATARQEFNKANDEILKAERWVSTLDNKTSPQCFPASTTALPVGDLRGVTRRFYEGEMIVVTTAAGKELRATPNHPVLTARGWRAIKELNPGYDVLYQAIGDLGDIPSAKEVGMPSTIGAIADTLLHPAVGDVLVERSAQADFHGDGMVEDHEVYVASTNSDLRFAVESARGKEFSDAFFASITVTGELSAGSHHGSLLVGDDPVFMTSKVNAVSVDDGVEAELANAGGSDDLSWRFTVEKELDNSRLVGSSCVVTSAEVRHYACTFKDPRNGRSGNAIAFSNADGSGAIGVLADDVVAVRCELFSGHVYNLSTGSEFYIAEGFVVHNCRIRDQLQYTVNTHKPIGHKVPWLQGPGKIHFCCRSTSSPVTKSWRELGIPLDEMTPAQRASMDGQVPGNTTYSEWLNRQSDARKLEVLGPARYQMLKDGKDLEDFYTPTGEWMTLEQMKERDAVTFASIAA